MKQRHCKSKLLIGVKSVFLLIGVIFMAALTAQPCYAVDWSNGNDSATTPAASYNVMPPSTNYQRSIVPGPPVQPVEASRPASWPGSQPAEASPWVPPNQQGQGVSANGPVPGAEMIPCEGARIVARVGSEAILESEVIGGVNEVIKRFMESNKGSISESQLEAGRNQLLKQAIRARIETKLVLQDAQKTIPSEGWSNVEKQLDKEFENVELEKMMKKEGVGTRAELDKKLRERSTSLEREKHTFIERAFTQQWVHQQLKPDQETTYDQMVKYYREHQDEFTTPARAQYEELMVRLTKYPNKDAARDAIAQLGNQVLSGAPFAAVAKASSDGTSASDGGQRPWTTKGSLAYQTIDQALFSLPVGQLSPILESPQGYHIIRVTQREDVTVKDFLDAQVEIRNKIVERRTEKLFKEYLAKLETKTPVWTVFDSDIRNPQLSNRPDRPMQR